jgi:hypothetical protein
MSEAHHAQHESKGGVAATRPDGSGGGSSGDAGATASKHHVGTGGDTVKWITKRQQKVSLTRTMSGRSLYLVSSQVGGSLPMLKDREGHICKPAAQAEKEFYEELPKVYPFLVRFVPRYFGCCTVNITSILNDIDSHMEVYHNDHTTRVYADGTSSRKTPAPVKQRWTVFQNRRHKKVAKDANGNVEFIMLEDITRDHDFSNLLDIKLGTKQYADQAEKPPAAPRNNEQKENASEGDVGGEMAQGDNYERGGAMADELRSAKLARAARKCSRSTSREFGFRINGMQIYREDKNVYKVVDKYYCRQLDLDGAERALERFLKYPTWDNLGQIRTLIADLSELAVALRRTSWRYYGLSLLLSYDPSHVHPHDTEEHARVDVRLIDFAKCERRSPAASAAASSLDDDDEKEEEEQAGEQAEEENEHGDDDDDGAATRNRRRRRARLQSAAASDPHEGVIKGIENLTTVLRNIERRHVRIKERRERRWKRRTVSAVVAVAALASAVWAWCSKKS